MKEERYDCAVDAILDVIHGKWKLIIIWHLRDRTLRSSELQRLIPEVTMKMLTQHLRELETDGVVERKVYPEVPPRVEYTLTDFGQEILPLMETLCAWGRKNQGYFKQDCVAGCTEGCNKCPGIKK